MGWRATIFGADGKAWEERIARKETREEQSHREYYIQEFGKPKTRRKMTNAERRRAGLPAYKGPKEGRSR